ncbi:hypothetical protein RND81_05G035600 [Saponaria officinalis]|uniref:PHD-type domain-containing protein n=1 Tax=Saponaria officinalis TaxID=3572 RepID=A0AAW1KXE8_SAPOF
MKREFAALKTASPVSESVGRKTRFGNSDGVSQRLVYKRVKRSLSTVSSVAVEGMDVGVVEVCNEVEKGMCDGVKDIDEISTMEVEERGENGDEKGDKIVTETNEDAVIGNVDSAEVEKENVVEETSWKTPSKLANGRRKKFGVEGYQRRFTRSALKCNVVEEKVSEKTTKNEKVKESMETENNNEGTRRVTRSSMAKPKEDGPDSCLTDTSDNVAADKENADTGVDNEDGECDMDNHVVDTETMSVTPMTESKIKLPKQKTLTRIPMTVKELFETGLLEGCPVYYDGGKGPGLRGRIRAIGICCPCNVCRGCTVIPHSLFEIHATNTYKRAVQYICLENGRSLIQILKACKSTRLKTVDETIQNAIGPLPERKVVVCQNCKEPFLTLDAECSDPVCSSCIMSNLSSVGPVYSSRKLCRSSTRNQRISTEPPTPQGASSRGKNISRGNVAKMQAETTLTPKIQSSSRIGKALETKTSAKDSEETFILPKASSSLTNNKSLATKTAKKLIKNFFQDKNKGAIWSSKSNKLTRMGKSSKTDNCVKITKRRKKETLTPKPSKTPSVYGSSEIKTSGKITRKDLRLHKLVFEDDVLPDGTELGYYARGKKLLDGFKKGSGIFCNCCDTVVSASQFESHAGCAARRKPYCYIYTSNGVSLHELSINLIKGRKHSAKFNDDLCSICADGGNLLLCDGCPRAFHTECASLSGIPRGKWYCKYCESMFEREKFVAHNANAFAAGRVSGVDPMEQITRRSIRIVNNVGSEVSSCILCREFDFSKSGFGPRTIILCDQCEKEYHVGCLKNHDMADLKELPDGKWFCNLDCGRIDSVLQTLLVKGAEKLPESLLNVITRKNLQNVSESAAEADVSWRLLSGKIASPETRPLLSQAVAIFHESFAPIVEVVSGHDLIPAMVYGRNAGGQEYGGMYCAVLIVNSVVVSAAIFRVFGPEIAELPLVATSSGNHGKGYFQALFACIERLLTALKVKTFVLPAAEEAESIWTNRFGFKKMTPDQLRQLKSNFWSLVRFEGTSMLHKPLPE